ncbi:MAG: ABC transporter ATP-binding protein [Candidatus Omnitrophica bacterium]|nr:ABC transporter ATP-binding protein [Candidatus Omnitrophota bacterium]MDD5237593.1 ABC transporter ATP-binding protein [Candidatus Omnitrophota bacterium]
MEFLLTVNNLSGGYHKQAVIRDISLRVEEGDFLGIIGPNGSGKTTLLRLMSRVLLPQEGNIRLCEKDINSLDLKEFCQKVAFVAGDTLINFSFTVLEIVLMGRIPHLKRLQLEKKEDVLIAENALKMTGTLELKDKLIDELSSGERQRVIIARALTQEPVLLFLDEPTSHLDIGHQIQILDLLKRLNRERNLTIVMVLHDLNLAGAYCNRILLLDRGGIFKEGLPDEVLTYQNIETVYKTVVLVNKDPVSLRPHVILVTEKK